MTSGPAYAIVQTRGNGNVCCFDSDVNLTTKWRSHEIMSAQTVEQTNVTGNPNNQVEQVKKDKIPEGFVKFGFRKTKDPETQKEIPAPDPIIMKFQSETVQSVAALLNGEGLTPEETEKVREFIVGCVNDAKKEYVKTLFDDVGYDEARANGIAPELYDVKVIAMLPPTRRGASGIPDELWEEFVADYQEVIVHHGVDVKRAKVGADIMRGRFNKVRQQKEALLQFKTRIQTWYNHSSKAEQLATVYEYLIERAEKLIAANEPQNVLASF